MIMYAWASDIGSNKSVQFQTHSELAHKIVINCRNYMEEIVVVSTLSLEHQK